MKLIIHLGVHKTASTFLQKELFPNIESYTFIERNKLQNFKEYILYCDDLEFESTYSYDLFCKSIDEPLSSRVLISDEDFYGMPFYGAIDRKRNIDRLTSTFATVDLSFIIVLRQQESLLNSLYLQYVKTGGTANSNEFIVSKQYPLLITNSYFKYDRYLKFIEDKIGNDNLCCLFYEDFIKDKEGFILNLETFMGFKSTLVNEENQIKNSSISAFTCKIILFLNKLTKTYKNPHGFLPFIFSKFYIKIALKFSAKFKKTKKIIFFTASNLNEILNSNSALRKYKNENWLQTNKYLK